MIQADAKDEDVKNFKGLLDYFRQLAEGEVTSLIEKRLLSMLDNSIPFFSHLILTHVFPKIKRLTVNKRVTGLNKRIRNIQFLKYPPSDKVNKYGRCNFPGQSILYASFMNMTNLGELKPKVGDLITESTWKVKNNQSLVYCPIFKNQPTKENVFNPRTLEINELYEKKVKKYPVNIREQIDSLMQFVTDGFTKQVHPDRHLNYLFSAYFSNKILHEFEDGKIEAIYYPSVQNRLSFENIAIKPHVFDSKYELLEVKDSFVVVDPSTSGNRGYIMEGLSDCKSFDYTSNKILWDKDKLYQSEERVKQMGIQHGLDLTE